MYIYISIYIYTYVYVYLYINICICIYLSIYIYKNSRDIRDRPRSSGGWKALDHLGKQPLDSQPVHHMVRMSLKMGYTPLFTFICFFQYLNWEDTTQARDFWYWWVSPLIQVRDFSLHNFEPLSLTVVHIIDTKNMSSTGPSGGMNKDHQRPRTNHSWTFGN